MRQQGRTMNQRSLRAALLPALLAATAACGGQLSEEEVLSRTATKVSAVANGTQDTPGANDMTTTTTINPGAASSSPGTAMAAGPMGAPGTPSQRAAAHGVTIATGPTGAPGAPAPRAAAHGVTIATGPTGATAPGPDTGPASGAAAANAPCTTSATGPVVIGNVGNYSGPGGSAFSQMPRAVQLWAATVNRRGGLCGREVKVIVQDDGGDPARYASLVRDLVENRHVVAFVGNGAALSAQGGLEYHRRSGVGVIGTDCTSAFWFDSPVLFSPCATPYQAVSNLVANGVALSGKTKFGYVYCTEAQACLDADRNYQNGAASAAGAQLVYRRSISITQVDFTAECQAARDAGADLFFVAADPATLQRFSQSCARQNFLPQYASSSVTWSTDALSIRGLENVALHMSTMPFTGGSGGAIDEYHQAIQAFAPGTRPGPALALGWVAGKLFELAAAGAARATTSITPQGLIAALQAVHDETLGGLTVPLNFATDGAHNANCYFSMQGDGTGKGYRLPKGPAAICRSTAPS
jgi:branched-chain amino acid transport system substrate-binding protein